MYLVRNIKNSKFKIFKIKFQSLLSTNSYFGLFSFLSMASFKPRLYFGRVYLLWEAFFVFSANVRLSRNFRNVARACAKNARVRDPKRPQFAAVISTLRPQQCICVINFFLRPPENSGYKNTEKTFFENNFLRLLFFKGPPLHKGSLFYNINISKWESFWSLVTASIVVEVTIEDQRLFLSSHGFSLLYKIC